MKKMTLTASDMKKILLKKLADENTYFTESDILFYQTSPQRYKIIIKDYEHIVFILNIFNDEEDDAELIAVWRKDKDRTNKNLIILEEHHENKVIESVLKQLGYYIGTRF